jgi:hypothetical protein
MNNDRQFSSLKANSGGVSLVENAPFSITSM